MLTGPLTPSELNAIKRRARLIEMPLSPLDARRVRRVLEVDLPTLIAAYEETMERVAMHVQASAMQAQAARAHHARLAARLDELALTARGEAAGTPPCRSVIADDSTHRCVPERGLSHTCGRPSSHRPHRHECNRCGTHWSDR